MAKQPRVLVGQVAAITGGARGIGKETARAFVREGMRVAIGDLDLDLAQATATELAGGGANVRAYPLDVTDRASVRAFVDAVEADLGPIDVFDNNAGIMHVGRFLEEDDETTNRQIDINVHGVLNGAKEILPRFVDRGRGHLVNVASMAGKGGFPGVVTYCGTKHFVVGMSEAIRGELHYLGSPVEVTCVMPAIVQTELAAGLKPTRGVKHATPQDVAQAIVDALKVPRFDVIVPRSAAVANGALQLLPRRGREGLARAIGADRALIEADPTARSGYEVRAAHSDPRLDAGTAPASLTAGDE